MKQGCQMSKYPTGYHECFYDNTYKYFACNDFTHNINKCNITYKRLYLWLILLIDDLLISKVTISKVIISIVIVFHEQ
jgi:hypothetical protein